MNLDISSRARPYFDRAGFNSDRVVHVDPCVPYDHPAHGLLARFGGLRIGVNENNEMLSEIRNDIAFEPAERYDEIHEWERLLRTRLIGVAETHHRHGLLYLSEDERFFNLSGMHDAMGFNGRGFQNAIDNLLFGQSMPMIRPDQSSVSWYGTVYTAGDAGLYHYSAANT